MASRANNKPPSSLVPLFGLGALAVVAAGCWLGLPGVAVVWVGLLVLGFAEPGPELTGPKRPGERSPQPADARELHKLDSFSAIRSLRTAALPGKHWLPGKGINVAWLVALGCAAAAAMLNTSNPAMRPMNALAAFAVVCAWTQARRAGLSMTAMTLADVRARLSWKTAVAAAFGAGVGAGLFFAACLALREAKMFDKAWTLPGTVVWGVVGLAFGALASTWPAFHAEWTHWREVRDTWLPIWQGLKVIPTPQCVSTKTVGAFEATVFDAKPTPSATMFTMTPKIAAALGAGLQVAVLPVPNESANGPIPGTTHPNRIEIVSIDATSWPDVATKETPLDVVTMAARFALAKASLDAAIGSLGVSDVRPVHTEESPTALWAVEPSWSGGPAGAYWREQSSGGTGLTAGLFGEVLFDHRAANGNGLLYIGDMNEVATDDATETALRNIVEEDRWNRVWKAALKQNEPLPVFQTAPPKADPRCGKAMVERAVFAARPGFDPREYARPSVEKRLATALGGATFVTVVSWTAPATRAGTRHAQAFALYTSRDRVPTRPDDLPGMRTDGTTWVLAWHINQAFDALRMPRPELIGARPLGPAELSFGQGNIWELKLRLYDGTSFGDVRIRAERLRQAFGSDWLRVADDPEGCLLYVGADPKKVTLAEPKRDLERVTRLDWEQAWADAKVLGAGNRAPVLKSASVMPANPKVAILDFDLVAGLDLDTVRKALGKIRTATGNEFVEARMGPGGARTLRMLASVSDPMPTLASFDYDLARKSKRGQWPFGVSVDGSPMVWNVKSDVHLLVAGAAGGGKSVTVQTMLTSMALKPAAETEFFVIDVQKSGADYRFMSDYLSGYAWNVREAAGLIKAIYAEGKRRLDLAAEMGIPNVADWPEPPPQLVLVVDEFASMIVTEQVQKQPFTDPEMEASRLRLLAENAGRITIGQYVGKVARELRSAGVTLILATQQLKQNALQGIPGGDTLKSSLARLVMGKASFGELSSALKQPSEASELGEVVPRGRGLFESSEHYANPFQAWFEPDHAKLTAAIAAARPPVAQLIDYSAFLAPEAPSGPGIQRVDLDEALGMDEPNVIELGNVELDWGDLDADPDLAFFAAEPDAEPDLTFALEPELEPELEPGPDADLIFELEPEPDADLAFFELEPELEPEPDLTFELDPEPEPDLAFFEPRPRRAKPSWGDMSSLWSNKPEPEPVIDFVVDPEIDNPPEPERPPVDPRWFSDEF